MTPVPSSSPIAPLDLLLVQDAKIDNEGATELLLSTTDHHHHHHQADVSIEESDVDTSPEKSKEDIFEDKEPLLIGVSTPSIAIPQPSEVCMHTYVHICLLPLILILSRLILILKLRLVT